MHETVGAVGIVVGRAVGLLVGAVGAVGRTLGVAVGLAVGRRDTTSKMRAEFDVLYL